MSAFICIDRKRDKNGNIVEYAIQNTATKIVRRVSPQYVKCIIQNKQAVVQNLTLTSDGRLILNNDKFQKSVESTSHNKKMTIAESEALEKQVDRFMGELLSFRYSKDTGKVLRAINFNPKGYENTATLLVNTGLIGADKPVEIMLRYRKSSHKHTEKSYDVSVIIQVLGIGYQGNLAYISNNNELKLTGMTYNSIDNRLQYDISKYGKELLDFIAKQCGYLCKTHMNVDKLQIKNTVAKLGVSFKKRGIQIGVSAMVILCCTGMLTGCGSATKVYANEETSTEAVENCKTYKCDYKTLAFNTKIVTEMDGKTITIKGNIFKDVTDPLVMVDSDGNVLGEATDTYRLFTNDDHAILIDGKVDVIMTGDFNIIGKTYKLYDIDGNQIGKFERSAILGISATITDIDGNIIADFSRSPLCNDYTVKIYNNEKMSDKSILLIMASFVSDDKADSKSKSDSSSESAASSDSTDSYYSSDYYYQF